MNLRLLVTVASVSYATIAAAQQTQPSPTPQVPATQPSPQTLEERFSYGLGVSMGMDVKEQQLPLDPHWLAAGLSDALTHQPLALDQQQIQQAFAQVRSQVIAQRSQQAQNNLQSAQQFLQQNAQNPRVQTLPTGLQYEVLTQGQGATPSPTDTVRVRYTGRFIDGTVFDSSEKHGGSATFRVNQVIPGWTQALQLMPVGSSWRLFVPPDLAYGQQGAPPAGIGPNQALIFEVELLEIPPAPATQPSEPALP